MAARFNRRPLKPTVISFDCYGTLIDWETGILHCLRGLASAYEVSITDDAILAAYSEIEPAVQGNLYRSYREILREVVQRFSWRFGFEPIDPELKALSTSLPKWRPFDDTVEALQALKKRYQLAIVSNIDNDLFAATARLLGVSFDWVITAQDVNSYKPALPHFSELLRRTGLPKGQHLHAAESLFHDIAPTNALGIPNVWVKRSHEKGGATASRAHSVKPDRTVGSLKELVAMLRSE
jgi:2-haloacid dehalogenase